MSMQCPNPKCRRYIALEATSCICGWEFVTPKPPTAAAVPVQARVVVEPRADPAVARAAIEKIRAIFKRPVEARVERVRDPELRVPMLADVGHGTMCVCEVCCRGRSRPRAVIPTPQPDAAVQGGQDDTHRLGEER